MSQDDVVEAEPTAYLRPRPGPGLFYGALAVGVAVLGVLGVTARLAQGQFIFAMLLLVLGTVAVVFLGILSVAILGPSLAVTDARVSGRLTLTKRVDLGWDDVVIDVDEDGPKGRFRLDLGADSATVDIRSWVGFRDFAILVASSARPARRLTPAARQELRRLLQIEDPAAPGETGAPA